MTKPIAAVSVALLRHDRFLLVRRGRGPALGLYAFPGGRIEPGETAEAAVRRELLEETGVTAGPLHFVTDILVGMEGRAAEKETQAFRISVFQGPYEAGEAAAGDDAAEAGWYGLADMERLPITETTLAVARQIASEHGSCR